MYRLKARIGFTDHDFYEFDTIIKDLNKKQRTYIFLKKAYFAMISKHQYTRHKLG